MVMLLIHPLISVVRAFAQNFLIWRQTSLQPHAPLVNYTVNYTLFNAIPNGLAGAASVYWHFEHTGLVDKLFGDATDSVVHWINVGAVWSGDMNFGVACFSNQTVLRALCVSAVLLKDKKTANEW